MKDKIIVIVGPTAVGKTDFSIELAKRFNGEVISGDSMQIYKKLDIGTAKATPEEMDGIPHHLIDIKEADESYSVSDFQEDASKKIDEITTSGKVPIIVGGTGLYIESLLYPVSHSGEAEPNFELRNELEEYAKEKGNQGLWERLNKIDPDAAEKIHPNNVRRVIRALEVYYETGQLFSSFQNERKKKDSIYDAYIICLNTDRSVLYERINKRVDIMIEEGLLEEAQELWNKLGPEPKAQSTKGIGYQELFPYFNDESSLDEAVSKIKQNSRRYAKRQLTWFRNRLENVHWYDFVLKPEQKEESFIKIKDFLKDE
ncbi:MAG TPA: tRNA (adenosine(37)-N6)-dimethylallyltransferase MiaA [Atopostipes sp.]|nr:tRNA (adenosine(37)-N6)-dimethylallyltransferase MiaA [Atopostipes sp.]